MNSLYNEVDETFRKPNYYTIVMGDLSTHRENSTNPLEKVTATSGVELTNQRSDTFEQHQESIKS